MNFLLESVDVLFLKLVVTYALAISLLVLLALWLREFKLRKKAQNALTEAASLIHSRENKLQTILNNAPIVFSAVDAKGIFHISEGKGLEKLGRKNNQSVGLSIYEMHNQNPVILEAVSKALQGEQIATSFTLKGVSYDLFIGPEKDQSGNVIGASMLSVEVTDRKRIEQEKSQLEISERTAIETSKLKSEFLATMSHEIRTPINGVLGMTSLLLDTPLNSIQKEYTEAIKQSGAGLLTIINDILDFSKIEAGKLDFEEILFDLPELIRHTSKSLKFVAAAKGIELINEISPQLPTWVKGDPGRLRQILNNLIGNAIKFTDQGYVRVRIHPSSMKNRIRVEIEDSGIGIAPDQLDKMFISFSQGEASMARRFGGTGLGLSISKQLVEKMGGEIGVTSAKGKGSTFWFELPIIEGQMPADEIVKKNVELFTISNDFVPLILVAEDNRVNQVITVNMLQKMGCNAHVVSTGEEAVEAVAKTTYDIVLMDCQMPIMDGLEATRKIRSQTTPQNGVPILAMTANAMKGDRELCLEAGMDDYVSKPISYEELTTVVRRWLEIHRRRSKKPSQT